MAKKFYSEGIRFECQGSGKCCLSRGDYGYVYLTPKDRRRMAQALNIPTRDFTQRYCEKTEGWFHIKDPMKTCLFLKDKRCTIYEARPEQCRTWPFWPEHMKPKAWQKEVVRFCPGVGRGKLYTEKEINELLKKDPIESQL